MKKIAKGIYANIYILINKKNLKKIPFGCDGRHWIISKIHRKHPSPRVRTFLIEVQI